MAQMPIQSMSGRTEPFSALSPAARTAPPGAATPRASYVHDAGGISGGMLRPGSIDQALFKAHLAAAQKEAVVAPPVAPTPLTSAPAARGIPTLSPAQLAALGVDVSQLAPQIPAIDTPATAAPETFATQAGAADGAAAATELPDALATPAASASDVADAALAALGAPAAPAPAERGPIPGARRGTDGAWELTRLPDKDERDMLRGKPWRVVESEASRKLFLGPDGEFGWDDFLDLINPLQHIPFVNVAYRAITGDEIYGAARMVDFAFGPLAGVSTAVDLAFRDVTGASMAENAVAALFGPGEATPGEEPAGDLASVNTASGDRVQIADAGAIRRGSNK